MVCCAGHTTLDTKLPVALQPRYLAAMQLYQGFCTSLRTQLSVPPQAGVLQLRVCSLATQLSA
jgi:hypothetical protein